MKVYVFTMAATSADWLSACTDLTLFPYTVLLNYARSLRAAGLFPKPSKGGGHKKTRLTSTDHANYILGLTASQAVDAPEVVRQLRQLTTHGTPPLFGDGDFGTAFDQMIAAAPNDRARNKPARAELLPAEIRVCVRPFQAELVWRHQDGSLRRAEAYSPNPGKPRPPVSDALVQITFINPSFVELASEMLLDTTAETTKAAQAGTPGGLLATSERVAKTNPLHTTHSALSPTETQRTGFGDLQPSSPSRRPGHHEHQDSHRPRLG